LNFIYKSQYGKEGEEHNLFKQDYDIGLGYSLNDHWTISLNYKQEYERDTEGWLIEKRPHINLKYRWQWGPFRLENRNRTEFRFKENSDYVTRYRNKLSINIPLHWLMKQYNLYFANELFYNLNDEGFNRNRFYVGFFRNFKKFKPEIFGFWQYSEDDPSWVSEFILAFKLSLKL